MTNISASLPVYTPPVAPPTPVAAVASNTTPDPTSNVTKSTNAPATNANDSTAGVYTALANAATSTIRGTSINIAT